MARRAANAGGDVIGVIAEAGVLHDLVRQVVHEGVAGDGVRPLRRIRGVRRLLQQLGHDCDERIGVNWTPLPLGVL